MAVLDFAMPKMDQWKAREEFQRYRREVAKVAGDARYQELLQVYKHAAMGRRIVSLFNAMQRAGIDADGRPKLAIARADQRWCWFRPSCFWDEGNLYAQFCGDSSRVRPMWPPAYIRNQSSNSIAFPAAAMPWTIREQCVAAVPLIPLKLRPSGSLDRYHILFEANWLAPPVDPLLLRRVGKEGTHRESTRTNHQPAPLHHRHPR